MKTSGILALIMIASVTIFAIPESNALTKRDYSVRNDAPITASTGNTKVCGNHICAPGEWNRTHDPPVPPDKNAKGNPVVDNKIIPPGMLKTKKLKPLASVLG